MPNVEDRGARILGLLGPACLLAAAVAACSTEHDDDRLPVCEFVHGSWAVNIDYGNGLVGHQQWIIDQQGCDFSFTADPPDASGVGPTAGRGYVAEDGVFASWSKTVNTCTIDAALDAVVTAGGLDGTLTWVRTPIGQGYCPVASGHFAVTGRR